MCDPLGMIKDVGLNLVTGGMYSIGKAVVKTVETGNPMNLLSQGLDLGLASTGNAIAKDVGGNGAAMAYNLAGLTAGAAGAGGVGSLFASSPTEGLMAPVTAATEGAPSLAGDTAALANTNDAMGAALKSAPDLGAQDLGQTATTLGQNGPIPESPVQAMATDPAMVNATPVSVSNPSAPTVPTTPNMSGLIDELGGTTAKEAGKTATESSLASVLPWLIAGQTGAGLLQGGFQGLTAQKQLELQRLALEQEQRQRNFNNANSNYAPQPVFTK